MNKIIQNIKANDGAIGLMTVLFIATVGVICLFGIIAVAKLTATKTYVDSASRNIAYGSVQTLLDNQALANNAQNPPLINDSGTVQSTTNSLINNSSSSEPWLSSEGITVTGTNTIHNTTYAPASNQAQAQALEANNQGNKTNNEFKNDRGDTLYWTSTDNATSNVKNYTSGVQTTLSANVPLLGDVFGSSVQINGSASAAWAQTCSIEDPDNPGVYIESICGNNIPIPIITIDDSTPWEILNFHTNRKATCQVSSGTWISNKYSMRKSNNYSASINNNELRNILSGTITCYVIVNNKQGTPASVTFNWPPPGITAVNYSYIGGQNNDFRVSVNVNQTIGSNILSGYSKKVECDFTNNATSQTHKLSWDIDDINNSTLTLSPDKNWRDVSSNNTSFLLYDGSGDFVNYGSVSCKFVFQEGSNGSLVNSSAGSGNWNAPKVTPVINITSASLDGSWLGDLVYWGQYCNNGDGWINNNNNCIMDYIDSVNTNIYNGKRIATLSLSLNGTYNNSPWYGSIYAPDPTGTGNLRTACDITLDDGPGGVPTTNHTTTDNSKVNYLTRLPGAPTWGDAGFPGNDVDWIFFPSSLNFANNVTITVSGNCYVYMGTDPSNRISNKANFSSFHIMKLNEDGHTRWASDINVLSYSIM